MMNFVEQLENKYFFCGARPEQDFQIYFLDSSWILRFLKNSQKKPKVGQNSTKSILILESFKKLYVEKTLSKKA